MTPEAKAAEEILCHQLKDQHYSTATAKAIIAKANAEHYLPLLRRWGPNMISMSGLYEINAEIARLEAGMK